MNVTALSHQAALQVSTSFPDQDSLSKRRNNPLQAQQISSPPELLQLWLQSQIQCFPSALVFQLKKEQSPLLTKSVLWDLLGLGQSSRAPSIPVRIRSRHVVLPALFPCAGRQPGEQRRSQLSFL